MSLDLNSTLRKLETYADSPAPILSVYLETPETATDVNKKLINLFHDLISLSLDPHEQDMFAKDIDSIEGYLQQYTYNSEEKGLAFFAGGNNLWEVVHTKGPAATSLVIKHSPNLTPLFEEEKNNYKYLIVLVDREKAKFLILSAGAIEDEKEVKDASVPQKINTGDAGSRQNKVDRHFQKLLNEHLKRISAKLDTFIENKQVNGVIIGGHKTLIHQIERHLPLRLQNKIIGEFVTELHISNDDILNHAKKLLQKLDIKYPTRNHPGLMNP